MSVSIESRIRRFWESVKIVENGCWEWQGTRLPKGYGQRYKLLGEGLAHRIAYRIVKGDIPDGGLVLHRCDNPPCVNPDHLFLGNHSDNRWDAVAKGRVLRGDAHPLRRDPSLAGRGERHKSRTNPAHIQRGEENGSSKLNEQQVRSARVMWLGGYSLIRLCLLFGVKGNAMRCLLNRKTWAHVN